MITYKRKRVTSRRAATDERVNDSSAAAFSNVATCTLPSKFEAGAENNVKDEDNFVRNLALFPSLLKLLLDSISVTCDCPCQCCSRIPKEGVRLVLNFFSFELAVPYL